MPAAHRRAVTRQVGLSPKVLAAALTGVVVFAITKLGLQLDPVLEQAINVAAALAAAYIAPPGDTTRAS